MPAPTPSSRCTAINQPLTPLVVADLMRGTGRYNLAQGAVATFQGIGASASGLLAGIMVQNFGYGPAFLTSAAAAMVAVAALALGMPETAPRRTAVIASATQAEPAV